MVSGRQTLQEIERAIQDLRSQEQRLLRDVEAANREHVDLLNQRTAAFRELAEVRARDAVADGVIDEADMLQHRVESLLQARQTTIDNLKARESETNNRRSELTAKAEALTHEIEKLEKLLDEIAQKAHAELASEAAFQSLKKGRDRAQAVLEQAAKKAEQAEQDRKRKGQAFEGDPLFMYLWERKYGTKDYPPYWLIRSGDDWVARMVGYTDARANYAILNEIPDRLAEHVARLGEDVAQREADIESAVAARINKLAETDLVGSLADARARQSENNKALEAIAIAITEISNLLNRYAEGLDDSFKQAVDLSAEYLQQETYQQLVSEARATPGPADDRIVSRIGEIDRKSDDAESAISKLRGELDKANAKRKELIDVAARFRRNYYDDPSSQFEYDDIAGAILRELINGAITGADYWARSQRRHQWKSRPADPFRRSQGMPPFGGGWGRGGSSDRGSGGGFRTGGGF